MGGNEELILKILREAKTIAVVGLSDKLGRASHRVGAYMKNKGYRIIPVNPRCKDVLGERCYPSLKDVPERVDVVLVFRRPEDTPPIAEDAVAVGAGYLWLQEGISNEQAKSVAVEGGLEVVMDRCMMKAHMEHKEKLGGNPSSDV